MFVITVLQIFTTNIVPILLIMLAGWVLANHFDIDVQSIGKTSFYIFSPALTFRLIYNSDISASDSLVVLLAILTVFIGVAVSTWTIAKLFRMGRLEMKSLIVSSSGPNMGNYGLSVAAFAFGNVVLEYAAIIMVAGTIIYNLIAALLSEKQMNFKQTLIGLLTIPLLQTSLLALVIRFLNLQIPLALYRPIDMLSNAAIPTLLVILGIHLQSLKLKNITLSLWVGIGVRLILSPLLAILTALCFPLSHDAKVALALQLAMPSAVMTTILASEYELDTNMVSSMVVATTLISPLTVSMVIWFLQHGGV
ncbi:MAG: AEC family transporter [Phototrophicaceae bacterium]